jgi:hypothetical protein
MVSCEETLLNVIRLVWVTVVKYMKEWNYTDRPGNEWETILRVMWGSRNRIRVFFRVYVQN